MIFIQKGKGTAVSPLQLEQTTHKDFWAEFSSLLSFCIYFQHYDSVTIITVLFISAVKSVQVWILSTWNLSNITLKFHSPAMFVNL